ncbi:MAG: efflux RND transporter periplasmic adaptor subunit [Clostridiales bacterium]|nr:efflux RND transporter periplasmic adaptor subunit [Clostridiales bacterium]
MSGKSRKRRVGLIALAVVVAAVAGLATLAVRYRNRREAMLSAGNDVVEVARGRLELVVQGSGAVKSADTATVYADAAGSVDVVMVEEGDEVLAGETVAVLDSQSVRDRIDALEKQIREIDAVIRTLRFTEGSTVIRASAAGVVKEVYAAVGDDVDAVVARSGALLLLSADGRMKTEIDVPNPDAYSPGQPVRVLVDGEPKDGVITAVDIGGSFITVTMEDDGYAADTPVTVEDSEGNTLGEGTLAVNMPLPVVESCGTIDAVYVGPGDRVSRNANLLRRKGTIPSAELTAQLDTRAGLQDDLSRARAELEECVVTAPIGGIVTALSLTPGKTLQPGALLFTVQSRSKLMLTVDVDELDISKISVGQTASVTLDALPGREFMAAVTRIDPIGVSVNKVTRFSVTLELKGAQDVLIGMSANADILAAVREDTLMIPVEAIQIIDNESRVILGDDAGTLTTANHRVVTGITDGINIEILEGLTEGDTVAVPKKSVDWMTEMFNMRRNPAFSRGEGERTPDD